MSNWLDWMKSKLEPAMEPPSPEKIVPTYQGKRIGPASPPTGHDEWPPLDAPDPNAPHYPAGAPPRPSPVPGCDGATWAAYEALLQLREGVSYEVYYDSLGKPTGGIGHLLLPSDGLSVDDTIPTSTVQRWFQHDGATAMDHAVAQAKTAGITSQAFLPYLASVCYQLGAGWVSEFPGTWALIVQGKYAAASYALLGSKWNQQTPTRVQDFQHALLALPPKP